MSVELIVADLSQPYSTSIEEKISHLQDRTKFDVRLIVHNAGTLGDLTKKSSELSDEGKH